MSSSINARAFTHQNHVYFNQGQFQPNTHSGKTLLAHELTHTIQQGAVSTGIQRKCAKCDEEKVQAKLKVGPANDKFEQEADAMADRVMRKCSSCKEEQVQRKSWDKEEVYNPYLSAKEQVQRKCTNCEEEVIQPKKYNSNISRGPPTVQCAKAVHTNAISQDSSGKIRRGFWDDPLGTIGGAISDAANAVADTLSAGIDWIKDKVSKMAAKMPGYKLFTVVVEKDPITKNKVARNGRNFIEAGLEFIPNGKEYRDKLIKDGGMDEAAKWLDDQMKLLNFNVTDIISDFGRFIGSLSMSDVTDPKGALDRGIKIFKPYVDKVLTFAKNVAVKFLAIVKSIAIDALLEWIKKKTTLYPMLTLILGSDPLSGKEIKRDGDAILRAVILLQADGQAQITKMEKNGALAEGALWIDDTLKSIVSILGDLTGAFTKTWKEFKISDLLKPTETFTKIYERFSKPVLDIKNFIVRVGTKILQIVRDIVVNELLVWVKKETPWYPLITVVLQEDPLTGKPVKRNGMNLIKGFAALHPEGEAQLKQMEESGALQKAANWVDKSIARVVAIISGLKNGFVTLWKTFSVSDLLYPVETFKTIYKLFSSPVSEMVSFALEVATMILKFIKDALIARLVKFARTIPGYNLVTVILGKDVFSKEPVERSAENIIRGFMGLIPGGEEKFQELKQSGVIGEAIAWIEGAIEELDLTWDMIRGLFTKAWNDFSLSDLATPIETFGRVMDLFGAPIGRIISFVGKVVIKLVEIALRLMGFPFELIGSIISRAQTAYEEIKKDPIAFLKNILKAVKQGFVQFFGNILTHLLNGVGDWLFGQLGDTGITIPTDFSFKSILGLVFEILGITKEKIFEKLKKKVGPEKWEKIEGMLDKAMGVWSFVKDIMERGPIVIWEKIQEKLTGLWDMVISAAKNWIMTKIIEQVTVKLLSLLDPTGIMAVVNSFIAFFKAVQSAIEYMVPMLEMMNSFLGGVIQIAQGNIKPAADLLESTMAKGMPIMIGFLANQVGLGSIGKKIKEIIGGIQAKVDEGIQWMIDKAWKIGAKMLEKGRGLFSKKGTDLITDKDRKLHVKYIKEIKAELAKPTKEKGNNGFDSFYATKKEQMEGLSKKYQPKLKKGIKLSFHFKPLKSEKVDGDIDLKITIAPNTSKDDMVLAPPNVEGEANVVQKGSTELMRLLNPVVAEYVKKINYNSLQDATNFVDHKNQSGKSGAKAYESFIPNSVIPIQRNLGGQCVGQAIHISKVINAKLGGDYAYPIAAVFKGKKRPTHGAAALKYNDPTSPDQGYLIFDPGFNIQNAIRVTKNESSVVRSNVYAMGPGENPCTVESKKDGDVKVTFDMREINNPEVISKGALLTFSEYRIVKRYGGNDRVVLEVKMHKANNYRFTLKIISIWGDNRLTADKDFKVQGILEATNSIYDFVSPELAKELGYNQSRLVQEIIRILESKSDIKAAKKEHSGLLTQPKLKYSQQTTPEEKEADNIAAQIVSSPVNGKLNPAGRSVQRKMKPTVKQNVANGVKGLNKEGGRPMDKSTKSFMENRFGADFSNVRIHNNAKSAAMSEAIQAKAFATGNNIYFNSGEYQPDSRSGKKLLAHELTHTIQQGAAKPTIQRQGKPEPPAKSESDSKPKEESKPAEEPNLKPPAKTKEIPAKEVPSGYDQVHDSLFKDKKEGKKLKTWEGQKTADLIFKEYKMRYRDVRPRLLRGKGVKKKDLNLEVGEVLKVIKSTYPMIQKSVDPKMVNKNVEIMSQDKSKLDPDLTRRMLIRLVRIGSSLDDYAFSQTDPTFTAMLDKMLKTEGMKRSAENFAINQRGFTEKDGKGKAKVVINTAVKKYNRPGLLVHELMHYFSHPKFDSWVKGTNDPNFYTEGFAEYVTRPVAQKLNISGRGYAKRLKAVEDKVAKYISHNDILRAYFVGEVWRLEHESKTAKEEFKKQIKLDPESEGKKEKKASRSSKGFSQINSSSSFRFLNFQIESAKLKRQHKKEFKTILGGVQKAKKTFVLTFVGHANDFKTKAENVTLSIARAKSFNEYAKKSGVDIKQIKNFNSPKGVGEANPIAGNQKAIGRAFNRRVDLTVM